MARRSEKRRSDRERSERYPSVTRKTSGSSVAVPARDKRRRRRRAAANRSRKLCAYAASSRASRSTTLSEASRFYADVLGFFVGERWIDAGVLRGAMLKAGACQLGLSQDDWSKGRDRKKGEGISLWLKTAQNLDKLAARIKGAGGVADEADEGVVGRPQSVSVRS